jgi:hypothetical protein
MDLREKIALQHGLGLEFWYRHPFPPLLFGSPPGHAAPGNFTGILDGGGWPLIQFGEPIASSLSPNPLFPTMIIRLPSFCVTDKNVQTTEKPMNGESGR